MEDRVSPAAATPARPRGRALASIALSAALGLGAIAVYLRAGATAPPALLPSAPSGRPLIAFLSSDQPGVALAGWDGRLYAPFRPALPDGSSPQLSPDGSRVLADGVVYDRLTGAAKGLAVRGAAFDSMAWADDSRHLCYLRPAGGDTPELGLVEAGRRPQDVAPVGLALPAQGPRILACSATRRRAVVAEQRGGVVIEVWTLDLGTGNVLLDQTYSDGSEYPAAVTASVAADLLFEQLGQGRGTIVRSAVTGAVIRATGMPIAAVSWEGALALAGAGGGLEAVRWRDGRVVWRSPPGTVVLGHVWLQPGGDRVAVLVGRPSDPGRFDLEIIAPSGAVIPASAAAEWLCCYPT